MKQNDRFKVKGRHPAQALLICSLVVSGGVGMRNIAKVNQEQSPEDAEYYIRKAQEKRERRAIKCIRQGASGN